MVQNLQNEVVTAGSPDRILAAQCLTAARDPESLVLLKLGRILTVAHRPLGVLLKLGLVLTVARHPPGIFRSEAAVVVRDVLALVALGEELVEAEFRLAQFGFASPDFRPSSRQVASHVDPRLESPAAFDAAARRPVYVAEEFEL